MNLFEVLVLLIAAHFIFDYVWQGLYLSTIKNPNKEDQDIPWAYPMFVHSFLHATAVLMITRMPLLFFLELVLHFVTDWAKCNNKITHSDDQIIHISCKLMWFIFYMTAVCVGTITISLK